MKIVFVSNYINHHQIPFCNAMYRLLQGEFVFVQTQPMEAERVRMGWDDKKRPVYVKCWDAEQEACRRLLLDCDVALFGGTDDEHFIQERLKSKKPVIRLSERLYKTGQWKAVNPRGLRRKYLDHTRYRHSQVWLLCAGAYVPSDFRIVRAYPDKMYCWGYFPETRHYDLERLLAQKGWEGRLPYLLWAGRMIGWKHPELALETARALKAQGLPFHMDIIGDGPLRRKMEALRHSYGLEGQVDFLGAQPPEQVRTFMEKADIFLFTSDCQEGWGAVANEAMNSGCALVADHMIGAVPYLVCQGKNGMVYRDGRREELFAMAGKLAKDRELCRELGRNAYRTITQDWNAEKAAENLLALIGKLLQGTAPGKADENGCFEGKLRPCDPAPILTQQCARRSIRRAKAGRKERKNV